MGVVHVVTTILSIAIWIYELVLWARLILDWVRVLNPRLHPHGALAVLFEVVYTLTDPPIRLFRKVVPAIRLGAISLDLGWMLTMVSCWILRAILSIW